MSRPGDCEAAGEPPSELAPRLQHRTGSDFNLHPASRTPIKSANGSQTTGSDRGHHGGIDNVAFSW